MANTDLFKQISSTVSEAGKAGLERTKGLRDNARITLEIRDRENSIQKAYRELGRAYFKDHRFDEDPAYDQIVFIKAAFEEIGELKTNKDEIRGIRRCPACGEVIVNDANFCPNCGTKYEEEDVMDEEEAEAFGEEIFAEDEDEEETEDMEEAVDAAKAE